MSLLFVVAMSEHNGEQISCQSGAGHVGYGMFRMVAITGEPQKESEMTAVRIEEQTIDDRMTVNETKQMVFYGIRWSAIFAGVVVGIAVQAMLGLLGFAGGLSSMSGVYSGESASFGPMLWAMVSLLVSAFAGGFFAARFSGSRRRGDGALYGAVNWAVSVLLFALILSTTAGTILTLGGAR